MARLAELGVERDIELIELDLFDLVNLRNELSRICPDELYNLAGSSSVADSFSRPMMPLEVNAVAAARLLEAVRVAIPDVRLFQPSTSEMFGQVNSSPQNESTPFRPCSPYAVAKLFSHWQTVTYRESYNLFAVCGILFNHESPLRSMQFVTRKITADLVKVKYGRLDRLSLGNLDVRRDWGFAGDFVEGMWRALQHREADDYVFATGISNSVRTFVELAAEYLGMSLAWSGSELAEVGINRNTSQTVVDINPNFFRPAEIRETVGDAQHAHDKLGWFPGTRLSDLVAMMVATDERRFLENRVLA
jgi:GDPmannose 4,6-dehydratase